MKELYLYYCENIYYLLHMLLLLIYQVSWSLRFCAILFTKRGGVTSQSPGVLWLYSVFKFLFAHTHKTIQKCTL